MFCCTLLYVPSSFAITLMGKREMVALLSLSSWCLVIVAWLCLAVAWVRLRFVIVCISWSYSLIIFYQFWLGLTIGLGWVNSSVLSCRVCTRHNTHLQCLMYGNPYQAFSLCYYGFLDLISHIWKYLSFHIFILSCYLFKKWIQFLECSWNHEYFVSLAK